MSPQPIETGSAYREEIGGDPTQPLNPQPLPTITETPGINIFYAGCQIGVFINTCPESKHHRMIQMAESVAGFEKKYMCACEMEFMRFILDITSLQS